MAAKVAEMTQAELKEMIEAIVEQKLLELLGDPEAGMSLRASVRKRLMRQKRAVAQGERGSSFEEVVRKLGLE